MSFLLYNNNRIPTIVGWNKKDKIPTIVGRKGKELMANIYTYRFNNFYNRILKNVESDTYITNDDMIDAGATLINQYTNINFNPNDGVTTELILNYNAEYISSPDYLLMVDYSQGFSQRWFIIDAVRLRNGQYQLKLQRDLIAEHYDKLFNAPMFVEKGVIQDPTDPMLFNKEDMSFNQIKKSETLLYDTTGMPWVVGYIPKNSFDTSTTVDFDSSKESYDFVYTSQEDFEANFPYFNYFDETTSKFESLKFIIRGNVTYDGTTFGNYFSFRFNEYAAEDFSQYAGNLNNTPMWLAYNQITSASVFYDRLTKSTLSNLVTYCKVKYSSGDEALYNELINLEGKNIKIGNEIKKIGIIRSGIDSEPFIDTTVDSIGAAFKSLARDMGCHESGDASRYSFKVNYAISKVKLKLDNSAVVKGKITISNNRSKLKDAPYDMFCMPYSSTATFNGSYSLDEYIQLSSATAIGEKTGSDNVYDVQILPYCPSTVLKDTFSNGNFDLTTLGNEEYDLIYDNSDNPIGFLFWCNSSSFSLNIPFKPYTDDVVNDAKKLKLHNELDLYRLCSPNYAGAFDFSPAMNRNVDYIKVDCTYKPYNPYIHVYPNFKGLYGSDFNDNRGLICGGDFSITQLNNAWANYQLNNKNYQNVFDRQIENLGISQKWERRQAWSKAITGTISGVAGGAAAGGLTPAGGAGAIVGGVAAGVGNVVGAAIDIRQTMEMQKEAIDYSKDLFTFNLQNIQAIPSSLAKSTSININHKYVPFVEYYTATDKEWEALENKIKYNGMTIMRIDTMSNYVSDDKNYYKAQLIRVDDIDADYHEASALAIELEKGVFI